MPGFVPQHRLVGPDGRVLARYDLADEVLRLAVEADGKAGHAGSAMVAKDRRRDRMSEQHGWRTERVTWWELRRQRAAFVRRITEVGRARRCLLGPPAPGGSRE
jgi:very-short-patch-repair endonuclease